ncbi:MAG: SAM-dependent methyltransferase [Alphaproteobacteria bacterium]|nr:SAM-dependent methyltransferase [Alphaproteobacteria bacterium]
MTNPLAEQLRRRIRLTGPVTVADYMADALGHPDHGYYMTRDPLGAAGDFTTAPEISQMFGELIGLWCAEVWRTTLAPRPVRLVELGPGRGTLMADALRAARLAPDFLAAVSVHMVETSPVLTAMQRRSLAGHDARWYEALEDVPDGPTLLIANEFFDALPIRQFEMTDAGWRERMVGLDEDGVTFRMGLAPGGSVAETLIPETVRRSASKGDIAEVCPAGQSIIRAIGERITRHGGAALIIDYGHATSAAGDSLQALRGHEFHDPLQDPGTADLTAHVDFAALGTAVREGGAAVYGPIGQGEFLTRLGIETRAEQLIGNATPDQAIDIAAARARLIDKAQMGYLFKVMAIMPPAAAPPPAFEEIAG